MAQVIKAPRLAGDRKPKQAKPLKKNTQLTIRQTFDKPGLEQFYGNSNSNSFSLENFLKHRPMKINFNFHLIVANFRNELVNFECELFVLSYPK